eukprot:785116-Alexandrium_andersonii.AAC.1
MHTDELHVALDELLIDDLREYICRVLLARPLEELEVASARPLLDPKLRHGQGLGQQPPCPDLPQHPRRCRPTLPHQS